MIDRNKLNRIKGVLSARQGAEIPKFQTPGGPLPVPLKDIKSVENKNGKYYVNGIEVNKEQYDIANNQLNINYNNTANQKGQEVLGSDFDALSASLSSAQSELSAKVNSKQNSLNGETPTTDIIGDQNLTPNTSVEKSAQQIEKTQEATEKQVAEVKANQSEEVKQAFDSAKPMSPNDGPKIPIPEPAAVPEKLEVPAQIVEEQKSAGMKLAQDNIKKQARTEKFNKVAGTAAQIGTQIFQGVGDAFGASQAATDSNLTKTADAAYDTIAEGVKKMGPVGQVVGTAMGFAGTAGDIIQGLGGGTDQMTGVDKWMDSSFFSWNIGMLNGFGGKRSDAFAADQDILANVGSSYGGTTEDINTAASKASKKYGLFSSGARRKANRQIADARAKQNLMGDISEEATDQRLNVQSMGEQAGLAYSLMTDGGYSQKYTYAAKHGGLLEWNPEIELEWEPQIELNWELPEFKEGGSIEIQEELEWIPEFKFGSHIDNTSKDYKVVNLDISIEETTQKNVIPEGALHKNKHHMEHAEGLTKKGIPVIDDDGEQQAEIEHSEIIFTLEVTKKLEEYYDIFYSEESSSKEKEQAALDAGKLLVYQILENTEDRTGLIESCKKGGSLKLKNSTDDLIEEVLEWMPTIVVIEEEIKEEKPKEDKKKSEKEQMKEAIKEVLIELLTK